MVQKLVGCGGRKCFCFAAIKFKAVRGTTTKVTLAAEHTPLVNKPKIPYILPNADLTKVHPMVKLFTGKIIRAVPSAGHLKQFLNPWKMLTRDQEILFAVDY